MKLTAAQRAALYEGKAPKITYPGGDPCPVAAGHVEALSTQVWLEVTEVRRTAKGDHVLVYTLYNNRIGQRFLAVQAGQIHPEQYAHSGGSGVDPEAGEAVDDATQKQLTKRAHDQRHGEVAEMLNATAELRAALNARIETHPRFQQVAGREIWRLRSELDRLTSKLRNRMAA